MGSDIDIDLNGRIPGESSDRKEQNDIKIKVDDVGFVEGALIRDLMVLFFLLSFVKIRADDYNNDLEWPDDENSANI